MPSSGKRDSEGKGESNPTIFAGGAAGLWDSACLTAANLRPRLCAEEPGLGNKEALTLHPEPLRPWLQNLPAAYALQKHPLGIANPAGNRRLSEWGRAARPRQIPSESFERLHLNLRLTTLTRMITTTIRMTMKLMTPEDGGKDCP